MYDSGSAIKQNKVDSKWQGHMYVCLWVCEHIVYAIVDRTTRISLSDKVIFELGIKETDKMSQEDRRRMF